MAAKMTVKRKLYNELMEVKKKHQEIDEKLPAGFYYTFGSGNNPGIKEFRKVGDYDKATATDFRIWLELAYESLNKASQVVR